jgi:hypothetical protein
METVNMARDWSDKLMVHDWPECGPGGLSLEDLYRMFKERDSREGNELHKKAVYAVDRDNEAAMTLIQKLAASCRPGHIIPVTHEEFEVLRDGLIVLMPPDSAGEKHGS